MISPNTKSVQILLGLLLTSAVSHATIIGGAVTGGEAFTEGGAFIKLTVPFTASNPDNTVGNNTFQNNNLYGFDEDQNVFLTANLAVQVVPPGGLPVAGGTVLNGTEVASHYVFFDPNDATRQVGYVDFDADILAIITSTGQLLASDYLANTGVTYLNPAARGLEAGDDVWIDSGNSKRMQVDWTASTPGDYVRILTKHSPSAVPEGGSTLAMLGGSLLAAAGLRRRSR